MWDPPRPGIQPMSPALQRGLPTTGPPGKPTRGLSDGSQQLLALILSSDQPCREREGCWALGREAPAPASPSFLQLAHLAAPGPMRFSGERSMPPIRSHRIYLSVKYLSLFSFPLHTHIHFVQRLIIFQSFVYFLIYYIYSKLLLFFPSFCSSVQCC